MEMNRIENLIADKRYYYDDRAIDGYIAFCEKELTLTDGSDLYLLDSFKLWAESALAWFHFVDKDVYVPKTEYQDGHFEKRPVCERLRTKQYLIAAPGAAKPCVCFNDSKLFFECGYFYNTSGLQPLQLCVRLKKFYHLLELRLLGL